MAKNTPEKIPPEAGSEPAVDAAAAIAALPFEKALAVFELLLPHCQRLGYENLALLDGSTAAVVRRGA